MKRYTVSVSSLRNCLKEDNYSTNDVKEDNSREIISSAGLRVSFVV